MKKIWFLIPFVFIFSACSAAQKQADADGRQKAVTGEWRWERMSEEEILVWSGSFFHEPFRMMYRWKEKEYHNVLDVGAAPGHYSVLFARNGLDVTALDINKYSMERLERIAKKENLSIQTDTADAKNMPYPAGRFDAVFANQIIGLSGCENVEKFIKEMCRVVKADGEIYFNINAQPYAEEEKDNRGTSASMDAAIFDTQYCAADEAMLKRILRPLVPIGVTRTAWLQNDNLKVKVRHYHVLAQCKRFSK